MRPGVEEVLVELRGEGLRVPGDLVPRLAHFIDLAHRQVPDVEASARTWALRLRQLFELLPKTAWAEALQRGDPAEHLIVAALADGDPAAVTAFEARYMPEVDRVLRRYKLDADTRDEYRQRARIRMLVGDPPKPPRIQEYRGRGRLGAWVRTVTARIVLNAERDAKRHPTDDGLEAVVSPAARSQRDPSWKKDFQALLQQSFRSLSQRERTILRMRYLDDLPAAVLARAFKVHESTVSRWLTRARENLRASFKGNAASALGDEAKAEELVTLLDSQPDLSLQGLFESGVQDVDD